MLKQNIEAAKKHDMQLMAFFAVIPAVIFFTLLFLNVLELYQCFMLLGFTWLFWLAASKRRIAKDQDRQTFLVTLMFLSKSYVAENGELPDDVVKYYLDILRNSLSGSGFKVSVQFEIEKHLAAAEDALIKKTEHFHFSLESLVRALQAV